MPLYTEEDFVRFRMARIKAAYFARLQDGHSKGNFFCRKILSTELIFIHASRGVF
jgi:hypothetical protein